ncbi:MAG TPA: hypothetical protein LFV66_02830 [Rickettsia endosymbiont of Bembidion lapponicum]|nr:hypothetical protein [Rickettsia endosymbiont of Bembidion lapponicum]
MKNKEQKLASIEIEPLMKIEDLLESIEIFTSIYMKDSITETSSSFFTNFYNTVAYGFNYALEVMAPLSKNICEYFAGTSQNIEDNLHVPNMGDAPELWDSFTSYYS